jgi:hypothetical protein
MKNIKESDEKSPDTNSSPASNNNIIQNHKNVSNLSSIRDITMPEKEEKERITRPELKYPTKHLIGFEELANATALYGDEYKLLFKVLWYNLLSYRLRTSKLLVGRLKPDGRISGLFVINSGRGKGEIKRVIKEYIKFFSGNCREPTSLHAEQLVGKSIYLKREKTHEERRGYLNSDFLIIDEAYNLLSSKELHYSEARKYLRTALDSYPHNTISKQLTELGEDYALEYEPICPVNLFLQPLTFDNDTLVLEGDIRRFIVAYVYMGDKDKTEALKRRIFDSYNDEDSILKFCKKINELDVFEVFQMSKDAKIKFAELSIALVSRGETYSRKICNFLESIAFTIQNNLLKFSAVQAYQHGRANIEIEDVELAFMDLFEIMEHTYEFIESKILGSLDYGNGWKGARFKDQEALKWLYDKGAISEENSNVSIKDYEDKLMELFNVKERRAIEYKNKHESREWIISKKAPGFSKLWLNFSPENSVSPPAIPAIHAFQIYNQTIEKVNLKNRTSIASIASIIDNEIEYTENLEENKINYGFLDNKELWNLGNLEGDEKAMDELNMRLLKSGED